MSTEPEQLNLNLGAIASKPLSSVEKYEFAPIKGYPMLRWNGKRPFTSTQYYPAQRRETYGPEVDGWRNKIYWGDNLQIMSHLLKEYRGMVKLVYIDPPFDSKADYKKTIVLKGQIISNDRTVFEEKQYTDIWINDEYLQFMYERLILIKELLTNDGSIYVQLDWHVGHYIKVILDEVFGSENFKNEIIWKRSLPHNDPNKFGIIHDTILFYTKRGTYTFNQQFTEQSEEYKKSHYTSRDPDGRIYRLQSLSAPGIGPARKFGDRIISPPAGTHWRYSQEKIDELLEKGLIVFTSTGQPNYKRYLDESKGSALQSIWTDINPLNPQALERLNYPTQKPEALLERIVESSSDDGDLIFDCFMGSGTTQAIAMKLGRRFIGADINLGAIQTTTRRLLKVAEELAPQAQQLLPDKDQPTTYYTGFEVYNVNNYDIFRNPLEARDLLIEALEINRLPAGSLYDGEKDGRMVKIMPINRIATRQDLNELLTNFDYRIFDQRKAQNFNQPVEKLTLVCMGHEPGLDAHLEAEMKEYRLDVKIVDILRDKQNLRFKYDAEASIIVRDNYLIIEQFFPLNLMNKLSAAREDVEEWRQLVDSIMIDWNYDGVVLQPTVVDVPSANAYVVGRYKIPADAGTIRVKITDLLSESLEETVLNG